MVGSRWLARAWAIAPLRYILEIIVVLLFEYFVVPILNTTLPSAGLIFTILLSAVIILFELSTQQGKLLKAEGDKIARKVDDLLSGGAIARLEQHIIDIDKYNKAIGSVMLQNVPPSAAVATYFHRYYTDTVNQLTDIINGRFTIMQSTPEQIWKSHIYSLEHATAGIPFYATCLVPRGIDDVKLVFENGVFNEYCRFSYKQLQVGRLSKIEKIFIVDDRLTLERAECLIEHLCEIRHMAGEIGHDRLIARLIIFEELRRDGLVGVIPQDFMIWGQEFMVVSRMDTVHLLHGLECSADEREIGRRSVEFKRLFELAKPLDSMRDRL